MSSSNLTYYGGDIPDPSQGTPGLWNRRFSTLSANLDTIRAGLGILSGSSLTYYGGDIPEGSVATPGLWNPRFSVLSQNLNQVRAASLAPVSALTYYGGDIPEGSQATPGLWNQRFSVLSQNADQTNADSHGWGALDTMQDTNGVALENHQPTSVFTLWRTDGTTPGQYVIENNRAQIVGSTSYYNHAPIVAKPALSLGSFTAFMDVSNSTPGNGAWVSLLFRCTYPGGGDWFELRAEAPTAQSLTLQFSKWVNAAHAAGSSIATISSGVTDAQHTGYRLGVTASGSTMTAWLAPYGTLAGAVSWLTWSNASYLDSTHSYLGLTGPGTGSGLGSTFANFSIYTS